MKSQKRHLQSYRPLTWLLFGCCCLAQEVSFATQLATYSCQNGFEVSYSDQDTIKLWQKTKKEIDGETQLALIGYTYTNQTCSTSRLNPRSKLPLKEPMDEICVFYGVPESLSAKKILVLNKTRLQLSIYDSVVFERLLLIGCSPR